MASSVAGGAGTLVMGRYGVAALGWLGSLVIVRTLSPAAWGTYSLIFSVLMLAGVVADLRVGRIVVRDLLDAGDRVGALVGSFIALRLVCGVLSYGVAMTVAVVGHYPRDLLVGMAVGGLVLVLASVGTSLDILFTARLWVRSMALASVLAQSVQLLLTLAIAAGRVRDVVPYTVPAVVYEAVALGWKLRVTRREMSLRLGIDVAMWGRWIKEAIPVALGGSLGTIYLRIDSVMLSQLGPLTAVGIYSVGYKFADLVAYFAVAIMTTVLAALTRAWPDDRASFHTTFRRAFVLLVLLAVGIAVGFAGFASPLISLLYGVRYAVSAHSAIGLVAAELLEFFAYLCFIALLAAGRNRAYALACLVGVVVNVALNLVLIPRWSYNGASVASVATSVVVLGILTIATSRLRAVRPLPWMVVAKALMAGGAMVAVELGLRHRIPWPLAAGAAGVVYLGVLHLLKVDGPGGLRVFLQRDAGLRAVVDRLS